MAGSSQIGYYAIALIAMINRFKECGAQARDDLRHQLTDLILEYIIAFNMMLGHRLPGGWEIFEAYPYMSYGSEVDPWVKWEGDDYEEHPLCPPAHPDPDYDPDY